MCGIVGYIGERVATPLLIEGLKRLEYRGYDSAGVAVMNGKGVETRKAAGKISRLEAALATEPIVGNMGIAHTRWATHGAPNQCNAHPQMDCKNHIAVVLCSILPAYDYPWQPGLTPAPKIDALNAWIKNYAAQHKHVYVDYHTAMKDARDGLPANLSKDGVHPTDAGYQMMAPLVEAGIATAMR